MNYNEYFDFIRFYEKDIIKTPISIIIAPIILGLKSFSLKIIAPNITDINALVLLIEIT